MDAHFLSSCFAIIQMQLPSKLPMPLGDNHYNPRYSLGHDHWLTSWISRPRSCGPRARNPLGQPVIALGHKWIIAVVPYGIGGLRTVIPADFPYMSNVF